eukprot:m51a1_g4312 hypothetical protein (262) ;mRNA; f:42769-43779
MSTRTERIFAAFQGPVLSLESSILHMFKPYTAELLVPRRWRRSLGVSTQDVFSSLRLACVRAHASSPPVRCEQCGDVVEVADTWTYPGRLPDDLESFCATVRSKCTSSRRHLRAPSLVLTVDIGGAMVCSGEFSVFAREPGRYKKKRRTQQQQPGEVVVASPDPRQDASLCTKMMLVVQILEQQPNAMDLPLSAFSMVEGVVHALGRVPGFLFQKSCVMGPNKDALQGDMVCYQYAKNIIPNAIGQDVCDTVSLLSLCRSW